MVLVALAAVFATPAQAQTVTLVSNFSSVVSNGSTVGDANATYTFIQAQKFATGANTDGYTLTSLKFQVGTYDGTNITPRVSIYDEGSGGNPGSSLYVLTGTLTSSGDKTFMAPADATLNAGTSYFVVFEDTNSSTPNHNYAVRRVPSGTTLDAASQSGWTIDDRHQKRNAESWTTSSTAKLAIELKGTVTPPTPCDALWCATMTVGTSSVYGLSGYSIDNPAIGTLTPRRFTYDGATVRVNTLAFDDGYDELNLSFFGNLGGSDYTLQLGGLSFTLGDPGSIGFFDISTDDIDWTDGETVTVKLFEGSGGVTLSDDATLTSLVLYADSIELDEEIVTLTPAFDPETTEYTAVVGNRFAGASIRNIMRSDSGASVAVTDGSDSHNLGSTEDSVEDLQLAIGETTITVTVTAADGTTETYTLVVTRTAPPPPAHCEAGDLLCATLAVAALSDNRYGYSGAQGSLSHIDFEHDGTQYTAETLFITTASGVGTPLRISFHPEGEMAFNTEDFFLYVDGTAFAFSDATFTSGHFEWDNSGLTWDPTDTVEVRLVEKSDVATLSALDFEFFNINPDDPADASDASHIDEFLTPPFDPDITEYTAVIPARVDALLNEEGGAVSTAASATVKFTVNGRVFADSDEEIPLKTGTNWLGFEVTAQDGETRKKYIVKVTRLPGLRHRSPSPGLTPATAARPSRSRSRSTRTSRRRVPKSRRPWSSPTERRAPSLRTAAASVAS